MREFYHGKPIFYYLGLSYMVTVTEWYENDVYVMPWGNKVDEAGLTGSSAILYQMD